MAEKGRAEAGRYLTLTLGQEFFALDINCVREILDMTDITNIPQMPSFMRGVVNVRGAAVPVIDLRLKFGMPEAERTLNTRIVIMEIADGENIHPIGAIADSVREVLELEADAIDPPPRMGLGIGSDFIRGIGKRDGKFILILDADQVFTSSEILSLKDAGGSMYPSQGDRQDGGGPAAQAAAPGEAPAKDGDPAFGEAPFADDRAPEAASFEEAPAGAAHRSVITLD